MKNLIIDSHQDLLSALTARGHYNTQTSIESLKNNVKFVHVSIFLEPQQYEGRKIQELKEEALRQMNEYLAMEQEDDDLRIVRSLQDVTEILNNEQTGLIIHYEGGESIENLADLQYLYDLDLRSLGIVWNRKNLLATPASENESDGLTDLGKAVIGKMIDLRMIIDIAHLNKAGVEDVYQICLSNDYSYINSHTALSSFNANNRNLSDEQMNQIKTLGGVAGLFASPQFLRGGDAVLNDYLVQIKYLVEKFGEDFVGIGTDFGGISYKKLIEGFSSTDDFSNLRQRLLGSSMSEECVQKIMGDNYLKFYQKIWSK